LEFLTELHGPEDQKKGSNEDEREVDERRNEATDRQDGKDDTSDKGDPHGFGGLGTDVVLRVGFKVFDGLSPVAAVSSFSDGFLGHLHGEECDEIV
jgi:hypothetical protein